MLKDTRARRIRGKTPRPVGGVLRGDDTTLGR